MKKDEKIDIIRWYISQYCCLSEIQTKKDVTNNIKELERMVVSDRGVVHLSNCSTCWHEKKDYYPKCMDCKDGSNYTFPYGYWKRIYEREKCE